MNPTSPSEVPILVLVDCDPRTVGVHTPVALVDEDGAVQRGTLGSTSVVDIAPSVGVGDRILLLLKEEVLVAETRPRCRFLQFHRYRTCEGGMKRS